MANHLPRFSALSVLRVGIHEACLTGNFRRFMRSPPHDPLADAFAILKRSFLSSHASSEIQGALDAPYSLAADQVAQFRRDGYAKIKDVLSPKVIATMLR